MHNKRKTSHCKPVVEASNSMTLKQALRNIKLIFPFHKCCKLEILSFKQKLSRLAHRKLCIICCYSHRSLPFEVGCSCHLVLHSQHGKSLRTQPECACKRREEQFPISIKLR